MPGEFQQSSNAAGREKPAPETWVFDLDNTLYPPECNLFQQIDRRMGAFIADLFDVGPEEARRIQKAYFIEHGTTLKGLMEHHGVEPHAFLEHVHDVDVSPVPPNSALAEALAELGGRKLVFTNASAGYAERVLDRLGIAHQIDGVYDIAAAGFDPKPSPASYERFLARHEVAPEGAIMIEDMARNLAPAAALGMTTVWLRTSYEWGHIDHEPDGVHHETGDLLGFLKAFTRPETA